MNSEEELIRKLRQAEAQIGELRHKLKIHRDDRSNFNIVQGKSNKMISELQFALRKERDTLVHLNESLDAIKRTIKIVEAG